LRKPKILLYDLEVGPNIVYVWGRWEQNVLAVENDWEILSFSYKWLGEKKVTAFARPDFRDTTDKSLCKKLHTVLSQSDIAIAHNGREFDNKKASARFVFHGFAPPSPYQIIDTKVEAKKAFKFDSNSLDDLGRYLKLGRKIQTGGFELWLGCLKGDKESWRKMVKYNKQDVALLEKVYLKLRPWMKNHPNLNTIANKPDQCPKCQSNKLHARGIVHSRTSVHQQYQCRSCGGWTRARLANKLPKTGVV